jgi:hypothetical protein
MDWKELFLGSDFFGVVECEVAGEVVSEYRVIESWKGPKAGERVRIRIPPDVGGPRMPVALVGERFLMAAYVSPSARMMSTTSGPDDPVWWRNIRHDYSLPLLQGAERMPPEGGGNPFFGSGAKSLSAFGAKLAPLARLSLEAQKLELAKKIASQSGAPKAFQAKLKKAASPREAVTLILELDSSPDGEEHRWTVAKLLRDCIPDSLVSAAMRTTPAERRGVLAKEWLEEESEGPPKLDLAKLRGALVAPDSDEFSEAVEELPKHDCRFMADWIVNRTEVIARAGYVIGSLFAQRCATDRAQNLRRVAEEAKEPFVRAAAAIYLLQEDETVGTPLVQRIANEDGDAGAWAALALARRGDKSLVPRLLRLLSDAPPETDSAGRWHHDSLQTRVAVLFSNSAKASKVATPPLPPQGNWDPKFSPALVEWWAQYEKAIVLTDPWLPELRTVNAD